MSMNDPMSFSSIFEDSVMSLPHHVMLLPKLEKQLQKSGSLGLVVIQIDGLDPIEEAHGPRIFQNISTAISNSLKEMKGKVVRNDDILAVSELGGSDFMVFLSAPRRSKHYVRILDKQEIETATDRIQRHLIRRLSEILRPYLTHLPRVSIGHSSVVYNPLIRKRRLINRLIQEARDAALMHRPMIKKQYKKELQAIIMNRAIRTFVQPIVSLKTRKVFAMEALTRGPKNTMFESPLALFSVAKEVGLCSELDRLCRSNALVAAKKIPSSVTIFLNTLPSTVHDPDLCGHGLFQLLSTTNRLPQNLVLEISERGAITNYHLLRKSMDLIKEVGVNFAIDDFGSGYSSLEAIVMLKPKFIKVDRFLVQEIANDVLKQEMLQMLLRASKKIDAQVVAEGIETEEEFRRLCDFQIDYGQGYYFAEPTNIDDYQDTFNEAKALGVQV